MYTDLYHDTNNPFIIYFIYSIDFLKRHFNLIFNRAKVLECSAKDDHNVSDLFKTLLSLSRFLPTGSAESTTGLKRRSSAYVSATSKGKCLYNF